MDERSSALTDRLIQGVMAYVVPGGVVLFAVATGSETVQRWFAGASSGPTLAGFAFVLTGALALGFVLNAVRYCIFEEIPWFGRRLVEPTPPLNETKRTDCAAAYRDLRRSHYDHYLGAANLAVALPIGLALWKGLDTSGINWPSLITMSVLVAAATIALGVAAVSAITRYNRKRIDLVGLKVIPPPAA
ncbi:MAG: hypothetical protein AB7N65_12880 [Vicinamibacterales bacterium]